MGPLDMAGTVLDSETEADPLEAFPLSVEFIVANPSKTGTSH